MSGEASRAPDPSDIQPLVAKGSQSDWTMWAFFGVLAIGGAVLFNALNASDDEVQAPSAFQPDANRSVQITSPAPLVVPPRFSEREALDPRRSLSALETRNVLAPVVREPIAPIVRPQIPLPAFDRQPFPARPEPVPPPQSAQPQVVFEQRAGTASSSSSQTDPEDAPRVTATRFVNPSLTIPQGTVIQAVLETALDSTRAGGVRALVQRDVSSFDGTRVLIPRGSRLYGEYEANLQRGQNRALVQWSRLIRPDGVTVNLDSPSSDPLGRAGVKGKVDGKFFQRFGNAVLQSVVDLGINVAVSEATDGVILALPGSTQNVQVADNEAFQPTLKVKHGSSVSVFVARDLDFSTVES